MMNELKITYSHKKQQQLANIFLILLILGLGFIYYAYFIKTTGLLMGRVSSIFVAVIGLVGFLKMKIAPKKSDEIAIRIDANGIEGKTSMIAKAAGRIDWHDIGDFYVDPKNLTLELKNPQKYADRMQNFFVRDTFLKGKKGVLDIPLGETEPNIDEIHSILSHYLQR
ncbi:STM3941 family protein [Sphingobacterium humi]|uniref:Uncharacterized protein n=1 Tax=Sphingobacterium humi TaxID=1796905 RepID=A0A6N8KTS9_9SPHI|nr:STM3941 family protein [Sphingobacterium humi]MVZ60466.1 hypothetical protein [Sphingobacterium humi]